MAKSFLDSLTARVQKELFKAQGLEKAAVFFHGPGCDPQGTARDPLELSLVVPRLDPDTRGALQHLGRRLLGWHRQGIPLHFLFTSEYIKNALDCFPLEFLDLQSRHHPVQGDPKFSKLRFPKAAVRLQCERDLRGLVLHTESALCRIPENGTRAKRLGEHLRWSLVPIARGLLYLKGRPHLSGRDELLTQCLAAYKIKGPDLSETAHVGRALALMKNLLPAVDRA